MAVAQKDLAYYKKRLRVFWVEWRTFFVLIGIMLLFRSAIADWNHVPSGSMYPGILVGDRVVVDKIAYDIRWPFTMTRIARWEHPQRGDIVTFPSPATEELYIKRVIGIPGDHIELRNNRLRINGVRASYRPLTQEEIDRFSIPGRYYRFYYEELLGSTRVIMWKRGGPKPEHADFGPIELPPGKYLMMGDHRDVSKDSRDDEVGLIDRERIIGRAHTISFSFDVNNYFIPRFHRFFTDLN